MVTKPTAQQQIELPNSNSNISLQQSSWLEVGGSLKKLNNTLALPEMPLFIVRLKAETYKFKGIIYKR